MKIAQLKNSTPESGKRAVVRSVRAGGKEFAETVAPPAWRLPGGVRLAEYALRGGFVASSLLARNARER